MPALWNKSQMALDELKTIYTNRSKHGTNRHLITKSYQNAYFTSTSSYLNAKQLPGNRHLLTPRSIKTPTTAGR